MSEKTWEDPWVAVTFRGRKLWVEEHVLLGEGHGALAPLGHIVGGRLLARYALGGNSFAHVDSGAIYRHHQRIGSVYDLVRGHDDTIVSEQRFDDDYPEWGQP